MIRRITDVKVEEDSEKLNDEQMKQVVGGLKGQDMLN